MAQYYDPNSGMTYEVPDEDPYYGSGGGTSSNQNLDPGLNPPESGGGGSGAPQPGPGLTPSQANPAAAAAITAYYNQYLGRPPQPGDVDHWLAGDYGWGNASNLANIGQGIRLSDEGAQYSNQHTTPGNVQGTAAGGFQTTGNDYSAFDTARPQDPAKSAKDAFVMFSNQAPAPPMGNKAALAAWFTKYIAPGMNNLGYKVSNVSGDGFDFSGTQGNFHVDYTQNAGGPGARLQWNATPSDAATAARYGTGSTGAGGTGGGGGVGGTGGGGSSAFGVGGSGGLDLPHYTPYPEWHPTDWVPPDPSKVTEDPGYQFRLDEGLKGITNARALQGLTRGGATMKALNRYGSDYASNEFGRIYDRAQTDWLNTNNMGYKAWSGNAAEHNTAFQNDTNEVQGEWDADWDVYKYGQDQAFQYWNAKLGAATTGSQFGNDEP